MPRSLVHVLLSLLLLLTQQLSLGHGYTHWSEVRESLSRQAQAAPSEGSGKLPKPALHDLCGQCAASAQVAFAMPAAIRQFAPAELAYAIPGIAPTPGICLLAACLFRSRAPPRAG